MKSWQQNILFGVLVWFIVVLAAKSLLFKPITVVEIFKLEEKIKGEFADFREEFAKDLNDHWHSRAKDSEVIFERSLD